MGNPDPNSCGDSECDREKAALKANIRTMAGCIHRIVMLDKYQAHDSECWARAINKAKEAAKP